jgi:hypothetical protein
MRNSTAEVISAERSSLPGSNAAGQNSNNTAARLHNLKEHGATEGTVLTGSVTGTGVISVSSSRDHAEHAVICNISDQSWLLHRTHGTFAIAACEPGQDYALTPISSRRGRIDLGDKRTLDFPITAREIADDLAREINSDGGEGSNFGVFVCEGSVPTDEEQLEAQDRLASFYRRLVAAADQQWERTHNVVLISDLDRRAARALKLEKEWCYEPQQRVECPACGEKLKPGVAVCRVCRAVLNQEKAAQFGLGKPDASAKQPANAA